MELRHLRYFLAVADAVHFTRASEQLYVSQPTLSHQIKQLEDELGTPLFDRVGKRVRLTTAGHVFSDYARRALREMEEAKVALGELDGLARGTLTIGVVQTVNCYLVPEAVASFNTAHPGVSVRVEELSDDEIERQLISGKVNLGIGFIPASSPEIITEPLFEEQLVLVVPESHKFARRRQIKVRELDGEPLVLSSDSCTRQLTDDTLRDGGAVPRVAVEMSAIEGILATVRKGGMASVLPALALREAQGVRTIRLTEPTPRRTVGLLWHRTTHRCASTRAFAVQVADAVRFVSNEVGGQH